MGAAILQLGCNIQCPHGGVCMPVTSNTKVMLGGAPALLVSDQFPITGCGNVVGTVNMPCVMVTWQAPAQRVTVDGNAVLLETSVGLCQGAVVQGTAIVSGVQTRVKGT